MARRTIQEHWEEAAAATCDVASASIGEPHRNVEKGKGKSKRGVDYKLEVLEDEKMRVDMWMSFLRWEWNNICRMQEDIKKVLEEGDKPE